MYNKASFWLIATLMSNIPYADAGRPSSPAPQQQPSPSSNPSSPPPATAPQPSDQAPSTDNNHPKQGEDSKTSFNQTINILGAVSVPIGFATMRLGYWLTREHDDILEPDHLKEDAAALHSHLTTQSLDEAHQQHLDTVLPHLDALTKAENVADVQAIEQNADHGKLAKAFTALVQHIPNNIRDSSDIKMQGRAENLRDHYKAKASQSVSKTKP